MLNPAVAQAYLRKYQPGQTKEKRGYKPPPTVTPPSSLHICEVSDIDHTPQWTDIYTDEGGNRLHIAQDMSFRNPFWAKMKAIAITDTAMSLSAPQWAMLTIPNEIERKFRNNLEDKHSEVEYLVVRTRSPNDKVDSHLLVPIRNSASDILGSEAVIFNRDQLPIILEGLFDVGQHPWGHIRWNASPKMLHELRLARTVRLIKMARSNCEYVLCQGMPKDIDFITRLSVYLIVENTVLNACEPGKKVMLARETGLFDAGELVQLAKQLMVPSPRIGTWKKSNCYSGMPYSGAARDDELNDMQVTTYGLWAVSFVIQSSGWDLDPYPAGDDSECPPLAWLEGRV